jgi:hypothetical protein
MRPILPIVSLLALIALTLPSIIFLAGRMELDTVKWLMLLASIIWFVTATPWMWKDNNAEKQDVA